MSAIEASSVSIKTMADGTLRISVDVEPRHAQAAFALFGAPGTPMALAALKAAAQQAAEPAKGGLLSKWVAIRCGELAFQDWLADYFSGHWQGTVGASSINRAAEVVRRVCEVESRAEIDNDEGAYERFQERIRGPWQRHCIATGATA